MMKILIIAPNDPLMAAAAAIIQNKDKSITILREEDLYGEKPDAKSAIASLEKIVDGYKDEEGAEVKGFGPVDVLILDGKDLTKAAINGIEKQAGGKVDLLNSLKTKNIVLQAWEECYPDKQAPIAINMLVGKKLSEDQKKDVEPLKNYITTYLCESTPDAKNTWKELLDNAHGNRSINAPGVRVPQQDLNTLKKVLEAGRVIQDYKNRVK